VPQSNEVETETRGVSRSELTAGIKLKPGHPVILLLGGVTPTPSGDDDPTGESGDGTSDGGGTGPTQPGNGDSGNGDSGDGTSDGGGTGPTQPGNGDSGDGTSDGGGGTSSAHSDDAPAGVVKLQVVSSTGKPRAGLLLEWTLPNNTKVTAKTDEEGSTLLDDELPSTGEVALEIPDSAGVDAASSPGRTPYQPGMKLQIGSTTIVELPPRVHKAELKGLHFETNKTFLLPSAMRGIRQLRQMYESYGALALLVNGHTDSVGDAKSNLGLSEERAKSIAAFLTEDVDGWLANYQPPPHSSAWGTREDQYMLAAVHSQAGAPFYTSGIDGQSGPGTQAAWKALQTEAGLSPSGKADADSRRALVTRYQALDGTTLPKSALLATHGCGLTHLAVPTGPGVANAENRRVELYLFEESVTPAPQTPCPAGGGCAEYAVWSKSALLTIDLDAPPGGLIVQVNDPSGAPVAGADVHLAGPAAANVQTGADGRATFPELIASQYKLIASKAGSQAAEQDVTVAEGSADAPPTVTVQLILEPAVAASLTADLTQGDLLESGSFVLDWKVDRFVTGTVVRLLCDRDPDGNGLSRPAACDADGKGSLKLLMDDTGTFVFTLSVGPAGAGSTKTCTVDFEPEPKILDVKPRIPGGT
jgi:outer membrane protein OmpA-like peptidoglycan-associated protein